MLAQCRRLRAGRSATGPARHQRSGIALVLAGVLALSGCADGAAGTTAASSPSTPPASGAVASPAPAPRSFSLVATGDVLLHEPLWQQAERDSVDGTMDFSPQLAGVRPLIGAADVAICHLETPLATAGGPYRGYPAFSVPPRIVEALKATGYDAFTTASNHSYDQGAAGIARTLDALDAAGLAHAGTARTRAEANRVTFLDVPTPSGAVRMALLSYAFGFNGVAAPGGQTWRAGRIEEPQILRDAAAARRQGAEVTVVALHWGEEYRPEPNGQQLALAPRLIASPDIDLLLGHHAHVVQPVQQLGGEWVVYGLGNLLAAHSTQGEPLREGLLARFAFGGDLAGRRSPARLPAASGDRLGADGAGGGEPGRCRRRPRAAVGPVADGRRPGRAVPAGRRRFSRATPGSLDQQKTSTRTVAAHEGSDLARQARRPGRGGTGPHDPGADRRHHPHHHHQHLRIRPAPVRAPGRVHGGG